MNRTDLQKLSNARLREAQVLLDAGEYSGAYYLAGYAVECALKSCIARHTQQYDFPEKDVVLASYSHSLNGLLVPARLEPDWKVERQANAAFGTSWVVSSIWSEKSRYREYSQREAAALIYAVGHVEDGVLSWVRRFW